MDKTKFMLFGNCKSKKNLQILIDDVSVERVNEIKFLGLIIDHKICWKPHIKYIQSKISRSIAVLSKAKHFLNYAALPILYCTLILPYLSYCVEVLGNTYKTLLRPLCTLQKKSHQNGS